MVHKTITVNNEEGLNVKQAAKIAQALEEFDSHVAIVYGEKRINAKSQINIISACVKPGAEISVECDGDDEEKALAKIVEIASQGFGD